MVGLSRIQRQLQDLTAKVNALSNEGSKELLSENKSLKAEVKRLSELVSVSENKIKSLESDVKKLEKKKEVK